jgi:Zn-dependent protease with chaperone function
MKRPRTGLSIFLVWLLLTQGTVGLWADYPPDRWWSGSQLPASTDGRAGDHAYAPSLDEVVALPSLELATLAERFPFDEGAIRAKAEALKVQARQKEELFKAAAKTAEKQIEAKERQLQQLQQSLDDPATNWKRRAIRCEIARIKKNITTQALDFLQSQIGTDVQLAKLNLLADWRAVNDQLEREIASGSASQCPFGNVLDIGARSTQKPFRGQEDDVRMGEKEVHEARQQKVFPKEIDDPVVTEYVNRLANNIARNSDLRVPLKVFLVQQEVLKDGKVVFNPDGQPQQVANAMALPGGFLIVFAGVVLESENESQLAGVLAHEISHSAARHANRLANKAKAFNIAQMATFIGLQIFAPGLFYAVSYLGYFLKGLLLQAIFNGMGVVFALNALGVTREFELEADRLGMQYAWKTGYDPEGFIKLFDHMSEKEGNASHTSFFATHPAFGDRTLNSLKEYRLLCSIAPERQFLTDTSEFQEVKQRVGETLRTAQKEMQAGAKGPSLEPQDPALEDCPEILPPPPPPAVAKPAQGRTTRQPVPPPDKQKPETDRPPVLKRQNQRGDCPSSTCEESPGNPSTGGSR